MADFYQYVLKAGVEIQVPVQGRLILVDDITGANSIDITPMLNSSAARTMPGRRKAFKAWIDYDAVVLKAAEDCTVSLWLSKTDVSLGFADGAQVNVAGAVSVTNDAQHPVPVSMSNAVTLTASSVSISNTNAAAVPVKKQALSTIVDIAAVTIPGIAAVSLVADTTLRSLRIRNSHATAVIAIGGSGVTLGNSPIRLQPGDVFVEDDAAGASWYAITDTPGATVQLQGLK